MTTSSIHDEPLATEPECPELYQVVVQCDSEDQQRELYQEMHQRGLPCKLLML
ncbi:hypothetical protein HOV93_40100 [Planctomycetes bacterium FF15]|uniref:Uncharacterized protein n=1 Tax=Bremerella alba TaxID=980252 RepID=A0A7V8V8E5_9BACT|nr:hypothetical protein [Bremerella alba]